MAAAVVLLLAGCGSATEPEAKAPEAAAVAAVAETRPAGGAEAGEPAVLDEYGYTSSECLCSLARPQPELPLRYPGASAAAEAAVLLFEQGEYDYALDGFDAIVGGGDARAEDYFNRGTAQLQVIDYDAAILDLTRAIEMDAGLAVAHLNLGISYYRNRDGETALEHVARAIELAPEYPRAHWNLGHILGMQTDYEGSLAAFDRAVELGPEDPVNVIGRAMAYAGQGRVREARVDFTYALTLTDDPVLTVPIEIALRDLPPGDDAE